jgi:uncharacterized protein (DUF1800 family)
MQLDRRQFGALLGAILAASGKGWSAAGEAADDDGSPGPERLARQCLDRLTFGARPADLAEFQRLGLERWLERQLERPESDPELDRRLRAARLPMRYEAGKDEQGRRWKAVDELRPYRHLDDDPEALLLLGDYERLGVDYEERIRPAREVQAASLIRAVHAEGQVREVLTQFWHEHFSVQSTKSERTAAFFGEYDRLMRRHALGNFRVLLGEVARSPAMLHFLDNESSKASPANENFARELLELHTLGAEHYANQRYGHWSEVPGARAGLAQLYIDEDVYEAARALTGWSFGDGRYLRDGDQAPRSGRFHYVDAWHDPYQKRILGVEFAPNAAPLADGEKLLDLLAAHPATARHIATKLVRRLLADEPPPELVASVAGVFLEQREAPDQIARVVRHLALSPHFVRRPPEKLKRPFEFLASLYRGLGAEVRSPSLGFHWALFRCGWGQHECRPPTGHPDQNRHWANTNYLAGLLDLSLQAFEPWFGASEHDLLRALPGDVHRLDQAARHFAESLVGAGRAGELAQTVSAPLAAEIGAELDRDEGLRAYQVKAMLALVAVSPAFLLR